MQQWQGGSSAAGHDCLQVKVETDAEHKINNSYQSLYKQMVDMMRSLGIEAVPTVGTPFNPSMHEAIMSEPNSEVRDAQHHLH